MMRLALVTISIGWLSIAPVQETSAAKLLATVRTALGGPALNGIKTITLEGDSRTLVQGVSATRNRTSGFMSYPTTIRVLWPDHYVEEQDRRDHRRFRGFVGNALLNK